MNQLQFFFSKTISFHNLLTLLLFIGLILAKIVLIYVANKPKKQVQNQAMFLLFSISIMTYIIGEIAVVIFLFDLNNITRMFLRIAWHMQPLHFFSQALFLIIITRQQHQITKKEKSVLWLFFVFTFLPLLLLIKMPIDFHWLYKLLLEIFCRVSLLKSIILKISGMTFLVITMAYSLKKLRSSCTTNILRLQTMQLLTLLLIALIPEAVLLCAAILPSWAFLNNEITLNLLSSALFTSFLIFTSQKLYRLRFLNLTNRVETKPIARLTDEDFLTIKEALCEASTYTELPYIHEIFFEKLAHIPQDRIIWTIRTLKKQYEVDSVEYIIEQYIQEKHELLNKFFATDAIFVYDELEFTNFYEQSSEIADILSLMDQINAAIFIPLKHSNRFLGAIIITKDPQKRELFPRAIQTQMQLYATYVTYTLSRLGQEQDEKLREAYKKVLLNLHQTNIKNARLQESITTLLKPENTKKNGILFYKNGTFIAINVTTEQLLQINPNKHDGHPLTKALKELARRVIQYGTPHTIIEKNSNGQDIYCQGYLTKDKEVIILVSFANLTNTLPIEQALLNPANLDYLIFLYGSDIGTIVNQALPGNGTVMVKAKIDLIKTLLSKKTMLLDVHQDDREMILSIAQKLCQKTTIHTIDIANDQNHDTVCTKLFGKQRFLPNEIRNEHGILYAFDESGIIHIVNAHLLDIKTQKLLLQFLKTGSFFLYKSEQRMTSNATIIFSSNHDLEQQTKQGLFLQELYDYLQDAIIVLPNLITLPFTELKEVAEQLQKQLVIATEYYHMFGFSNDELEKLDANRPISYQDLNKIVHAITKKHMQQSLFINETIKLSESTPKDQTLLDAARLGKQTLKDRKLMQALWNKFKNQTKIAQLLDVDRSSVHRRLKEYGIGEVEPVL